MIHGFLTEIVGSKWKEKKTSNRFSGLFAPSDNQMTQLDSGDPHNLNSCHLKSAFLSNS